MNRLTVVKVGGKVVEDTQAINLFLSEFIKISGNKILVHGGGNKATEFASNLGVETKMIDGRRITDAQMLEIVLMVYAGLINKKIVAKLQSLGCNSLGMTGADLDVIRAKKREHPEIDFGFVGDIEEINTKELRLLLDEGLTPVMSPLTHDGYGQMLNTNADTIASSLVIELSNIYNVHLVYCFDKQGVLSDPENENSIIHRLSYSEYLELKEKKIISEGMIPKLDNSFNAIKNGVEEVIITNAQNISTGKGTRLSI